MCEACRFLLEKETRGMVDEVRNAPPVKPLWRKYAKDMVTQEPLTEDQVDGIVKTMQGMPADDGKPKRNRNES